MSRSMRCDDGDEILTSLPALTHPLTSWIKPRPIILKSMIRVRGSSTCSFVARSDLSFMFAYELGPFLLTPTPIMYGTSILAKRDEYLARASNWSDAGDLAGVVAALGRLTAGREATDVVCLIAQTTPRAFPEFTARCCRRRLYSLVKSYDGGNQKKGEICSARFEHPPLSAISQSSSSTLAW